MVRNVGARSTVTAVLLLAGCLAAPNRSAPETPESTFCNRVGGVWDASVSRCTLTRDSATGIHVKVSEAYPADLIGDSTAGPVLQAFLRKFFDDFGTPDSRGNGQATLQYSLFHRAPSTESLVFESDWYFQGMPHPRAELTTFTFDLARHRQLQLADLFCPGSDPRQALPPLIRADTRHRLAETRFSVQDFEPGGTFFDGYDVWALDADDLMLYLPAARGPGGMPPGFVRPQIPLTMLRSALRDGGCSS